MLDFFKVLKECKNDDGVYLVDDVFALYVSSKYNDYQKLIKEPKLFYDMVNTICEQYNVAFFSYDDEFYLKVTSEILNQNYEVKVFSSEGNRIELFYKKENVNGSINNKLRKIVIDNRLFYYLDVKSFKSIEEYDEAFLQIVNDFAVVGCIDQSDLDSYGEKVLDNKDVDLTYIDESDYD